MGHVAHFIVIREVGLQPVHEIADTVDQVGPLGDCEDGSEKDIRRDPQDQASVGWVVASEPEYVGQGCYGPKGWGD